MTTESAAERYTRFAQAEAPGRSTRYAEWASVAASDAAVLQVLESLTPMQREPALVFGVTRLLGVSADASGAVWATFFLERAAAITAQCRARTVQTNEPLRLAALLPALSRIDGPIALVELGASAGLCLYPDRYSYRYLSAGSVVAALDPPGGVSDVVLVSEASGAALPTLRHPEIVWRGGIERHPIDVTNPHDLEWLRSLVWPGETERAARTDAAVRVAAADPPLIVAGEITSELAALAAQARAAAGSDATLVVMTPGVMTYLTWPERSAVLAEIARLGARWLTIDPPTLYDALQPVTDRPDWPATRPAFVVALDGIPLAAADPLGRWVHVLG